MVRMRMGWVTCVCVHWHEGVVVNMSGGPPSEGRGKAARAQRKCSLGVVLVRVSGVGGRPAHVRFAKRA